MRKYARPLIFIKKGGQRENGTGSLEKKYQYALVLVRGQNKVLLNQLDISTGILFCLLLGFFQILP